MLATANHYNEYDGNGSTTIFAYTFKIWAAADLRVMKIDTTTGEETLLTLTTHYTVDGVGETSGGNVTVTVAPTATEVLVIGRVRDVLQETDLVNQGAFYPDTHEDALDKIVMLLQDIQGRNANPPEFTTATRPTACSYWRGRKIYIKNAGVTSRLEACMEDSDGYWSWVTAVPGPV